MKLIEKMVWLGGAAWLMSACAQSGERAPARAPSSAEASEAPAAGAHDESSMYTCPMHPEVQHAGPGECPKCGMKLVPAEKTAPAAEPSAEPD